MMRYDAATRTVVMDLFDIEHMGFNHDDFDFELGSRGCDDPAARWPVALIINFAGGYVLWGGSEFDPNDSRLAQRKADYEQFQAMLANLGIQP